jgi:hypothetical protein
MGTNRAGMRQTVKKWEESTPYIQDYRQWFRFCGHLVLRVQEASKRGQAEGPWFNFVLLLRRSLSDGVNESMKIDEGGAKSCAAAKRLADQTAYALLKGIMQKIGVQPVIDTRHRNNAQ